MNLLDSIRPQLNENEILWLEQALSLASPRAWALAFVMCPRKIAKQPLGLNLNPLLSGWGEKTMMLSQWARWALIQGLGRAQWPKEAYQKALMSLFETAEMNESVALVSALPLFLYPEDWMEKARESVRSNVGLIFDAIAFENPYPKTHFSQDAWNQLVLKCIFNDKPVHRIDGLLERNNPALAQTLRDFTQERWSAGRRIPAQVWRLFLPYLQAHDAPNVIKLMASNHPWDRLAACLLIRDSSIPAIQELKNSYAQEILAHTHQDWAALEQEEPIYNG